MILRQKVRDAGGECCLINDEVIPTLDLLVQMGMSLSTIVSHEEIGLLRTYERDKAVKQWCKAHEVPWHEMPQTGVFRGLKDRDERTQLWREWMNNGPLSPPTVTQLQALRVPDEIMKRWPGHERRWTAEAYGCRQGSQSTWHGARLLVVRCMRPLQTAWMNSKMMIPCDPNNLKNLCVLF